MVLQNWVSFLKKQKGLFAILMVSQIVSLVCILFVFGVFQNNLYELSANVDTKFLNASFRKSTVTREQLTKVIKTLTDDYDFSIDYIYIDASVKGSDMSYQDRVQYKDGVFSYSDRVLENVKGSLDGEMAQPVHYKKAEKVVVISPNIKKDIGQTITLDGENYQIIGINNVNGDGEMEMPYLSFPKKAHYDTFSVELTMLPTRSQYDDFCQELKAIGGECDDFYIQNNADRKKEYSMIGISVLLALLAGGNMYMIYRFIFKKRRKKLAVFLLCGCSKKRARMLFFTEISCNMLCVVIVATGLFRFVVFPQMLTWFKYVDRIYGIKEYGTIIGIFLFVVLLIGYALSFSITRKSILDFKRGEL